MKEQIEQIESLFYRHEYYRDCICIPSDLDKTVQELEDEFLDELHKWHLTQPEGMLELIKNHEYRNSIYNHSVYLEGYSGIEVAYQHIFVTTDAYAQTFPLRKLMYEQLIKERTER